MSAEERLVALIPPWDRLPEVVKGGFRLESIPGEKKVMAWREDLQDEQSLVQALKGLGVATIEVRTKKVTTRWQDVQ